MSAHPGFPPGRIGSLLGGVKGVLQATRATGALLRAQRARYPGGYIRAVNYHATSARDRDRFRDHMAWFAERFSAVSHEDLAGFLETGRWPRSKPGLIVSFDDGLRSNYDVALPLLEEFGFVGWFFPPVDFIDSPPAEQAAFARRQWIDVEPEEVDAGRIAMTWNEVRDLAERHVVGCHTMTHRRLGDDLSDEELEHEIVTARGELESRLGLGVDVFCWVGGEESSYSARAAAAIRRAGYRFSFMTVSAPILPSTNPLQLQRINVDARWSTDWVAFQVCGVLDALYTGKRKRVVEKTKG